MQFSGKVKDGRTKRRTRIRGRLSGTGSRPRLAVFKSAKHIYVQAIDDEKGITLAQASTLDKEYPGKGGGGNLAAARAIGTMVGVRLKGKGFEHVVFDRGGYRYHGRIRAVAEAAREAGLKF